MALENYVDLDKINQKVLPKLKSTKKLFTSITTECSKIKMPKNFAYSSAVNNLKTNLNSISSSFNKSNDKIISKYNKIGNSQKKVVLSNGKVLSKQSVSLSSLFNYNSKTFKKISMESFNKTSTKKAVSREATYDRKNSAYHKKITDLSDLIYSQEEMKALVSKEPTEENKQLLSQINDMLSKYQSQDKILYDMAVARNNKNKKEKVLNEVKEIDVAIKSYEKQLAYQQAEIDFLEFINEPTFTDSVSQFKKRLRSKLDKTNYTESQKKNLEKAITREYEKLHEQYKEHKIIVSGEDPRRNGFKEVEVWESQSAAIHKSFDKYILAVTPQLSKYLGKSYESVTNKDSFDSLIKQKKSEYDECKQLLYNEKLLRTEKYYSQYQYNSDFNEKSKSYNVSLEQAEGYYLSWSTSNGQSKTLLGPFTDEKELKLYIDKLVYLSEDDQKKYFYLKNVYGDKKAKQFLKDYEDKINKTKGSLQAMEFLNSLSVDNSYKMTKEEQARYDSLLNNNQKTDESEKYLLSLKIKDNLPNFLGTTGKGLLDGIDSFFEGIGLIFRKDGIITADQYEKMVILECLQNSSLLTNTYQISSSIGNMLPSIAASAIATVLLTPAGGAAVAGATTATKIGATVGSVLMGLSSGGQAKNQALLDGASTYESIIYGLLVGGSDAALEYFFGGIPGLSKIDDIPGLKGYITKALKEGSTEAIQEIWQGGILDTIILNKKVDVNELFQSTGASFLYGVATAGIMNGVSSIPGSVEKINQLRNNIDFSKVNDPEYINNMKLQLATYLGIKLDNNIENGGALKSATSKRAKAILDRINNRTAETSNSGDSIQQATNAKTVNPRTVASAKNAPYVTARRDNQSFVGNNNVNQETVSSATNSTINIDWDVKVAEANRLSSHGRQIMIQVQSEAQIPSSFFENLYDIDSVIFMINGKLVEAADVKVTQQMDIMKSKYPTTTDFTKNTLEENILEIINRHDVKYKEGDALKRLNAFIDPNGENYGNYDIITSSNEARAILDMYTPEQIAIGLKNISNNSTSTNTNINNQQNIDFTKNTIEENIMEIINRHDAKYGEGDALLRLNTFIDSNGEKYGNYDMITSSNEARSILTMYTPEQIATGLNNIFIADSLNRSSSNVEMYNFFGQSNIDYGSDQAAIESLCVYTLDGVRYNYRQIMHIVNDYQEQGLPIPKIKKEATQEYMNLREKLTNRGFSSKEASIILSSINDAGACTYATACNEIFYQFRNNPDFFEESFGFPMYKNVGGIKTLNTTELLFDIYMWVNDLDNGGPFFYENRILPEALSTKIDWQGKTLLDAEHQIYMSDGNGMNTDYIGRYLKSKNPNLNFNSELVINNYRDRNNFEPLAVNNIINKLKNAITDGKSISLGIYFDKNDPNRVINMYSYDLSMYKNERTDSWEEGGGHSLTVTGITDDNSGLIVSSWGEKYCIPISDLMNGGLFDIAIDNISFGNINSNSQVTNISQYNGMNQNNVNINPMNAESINLRHNETGINKTDAVNHINGMVQNLSNIDLMNFIKSSSKEDIKIISEVITDNKLKQIARNGSRLDVNEFKTLPLDIQRKYIDIFSTEDINTLLSPGTYDISSLSEDINNNIIKNQNFILLKESYKIDEIINYISSNQSIIQNLDDHNLVKLLYNIPKNSPNIDNVIAEFNSRVNDGHILFDTSVFSSNPFGANDFDVNNIAFFKLPQEIQNNIKNLGLKLWKNIPKEMLDSNLNFGTIFQQLSLASVISESVSPESIIKIVQKINDENVNGLKIFDFNILNDEMLSLFGEDFLTEIGKYNNLSKKLLYLQQNNKNLLLAFAEIIKNSRADDSLGTFYSKSESCLNYLFEHSLEMNSEDYSVFSSEDFINYVLYNQNYNPDYLNIDYNENYEQEFINKCDDNFSKESQLYKSTDNDYLRKTEFKNMKEAYFEKFFSMSFNQVEQFILKYSSDIDSVVKNSNMDFNTKDNCITMLNLLQDVLNTEDVEYLKDLYINQQFKLNPEEIICMDNALRGLYGESYASALTKTKNAINNSIIETISYNGKEVNMIEMDGDFAFLVYSSDTGFVENKKLVNDSYKDTWNNTTNAKTHELSTSYISNDNIGSAPVLGEGVLYAFTNVDADNIRMMAPYDIDGHIADYGFSSGQKQIFVSADNMSRNTVRVYNEIVLNNRTEITPDYIILYSDSTEQNINSALKSAAEWEIPIIKIDKVKLAQNQIKKVSNLITEFENTGDLKVMKNFVELYEANISGFKLNAVNDENSATATINNKSVSEMFNTASIESAIEKYLTQISNLENNDTQINEFVDIMNNLKGKYDIADKNGTKVVSRTKSSIDIEKLINEANSIKKG